MKSLNRPTIAPSAMLAECIDGVSNGPAQAHYAANRGQLEQGIINFDAASATITWCNLPRTPHGQKTLIIAGTLTKEQLTNLYSTYMVRSSGSARGRYDEILVAANGKCPFCGGIGHAKTLDHYLPKANFPLYSVIPTNLVPCCRDCNSGKSNAFPTNVDSQTLHPYLDAEHFFNQKWTFATVIPTEPISVQFEVRPPLDWSAVDRQRVASHFQEYELASRYSIESATEIASLIYLRKTTFRGYSAVGFREYLAEQGQNPSTPINGWRRTLYFALAVTEWFCEAEY